MQKLKTKLRWSRLVPWLYISSVLYDEYKAVFPIGHLFVRAKRGKTQTRSFYLNLSEIRHENKLRSFLLIDHSNLTCVSPLSVSRDLNNVFLQFLNLPSLHRIHISPQICPKSNHMEPIKSNTQTTESSPHALTWSWSCPFALLDFFPDPVW